MKLVITTCEGLHLSPFNAVIRQHRARLLAPRIEPHACGHPRLVELRLPLQLIAETLRVPAVDDEPLERVVQLLNAADGGAEHLADDRDVSLAKIELIRG